MGSTANSGAVQGSSLVKLSSDTHVANPRLFLWVSRHIKSHVLCQPPFDRTLGPLDRECGQALMKYHDPQNRVQRDDVIQDMMELLLDVTYRLLWQDEIATLPRWYYTFPARKPTALPLECEKWSRSALVVLHVNLRPTCAVAHI